MELQNKERKHNNEKKVYKKVALFSFILSAILIAIYIYSSNQAQERGGTWWDHSYYWEFTLISLFLSFTTAVISIVYFFKYKQNTRNIIYKNISIEVVMGIVLLILISSWHLITGLKISITEWIIIAIGIILVSLGIFKKSQ